MWRKFSFVVVYACRWGAVMRINTFDPDDIKVLVTAFEGALQKLGLVQRTDAVTLSVAKRIMALAEQGERDPIRLRDAGCLNCYKDPCLYRMNC